MILYYVATYYQLLCAIAHKLTYHPQQPAHLLVDQFLLPKVKRIQATHIFSQVNLFPFILITENMEQNYRIVREQFSLSCSQHVRDFEKIYIAGAHNAISMLLLTENVRFSIFEECSGIMSNLSKLRENVYITSPVQDSFMAEHGIYDGSNPLIEQVYCDMQSQSQSFTNDKAVDFNLMSHLDRLDNKDLDKIIDIFVPNGKLSLAVGTHSCLLLTQHFANLKILDWEQQRELYQLLADYFLNQYDKLIVKPHPADNMYYEKILRNSEIIKELFPSELIPYIFKESIFGLATVSSTAINSLSPYFKECIKFDFSFEQQYFLVHHYYVALKITLSFLSAGYSMYCCGTNNTIVSNILKSLSAHQVFSVLNSIQDLLSVPKKSIVLLDDLNSTEEDIQFVCSAIRNKADTIFIYLNSNFKYLSYHIDYKDIWRFCSPIDIILHSKNSEQKKKLFIYDRNKEITREMCNSKKHLDNLDMDVVTHEYEGDALKIKVLEGILEATEERLRYYIKKIEQMEERK